MQDNMVIKRTGLSCHMETTSMGPSHVDLPGCMQHACSGVDKVHMVLVVYDESMNPLDRSLAQI